MTLITPRWIGVPHGYLGVNQSGVEDGEASLFAVISRIIAE